MSKHDLGEILAGGFEGSSDPETLNLLGHIRTDHVRAEKFPGIGVERSS